jgi:peroxin-10
VASLDGPPISPKMNKSTPPMYPFATAPAILRASQRDEFYIIQIRSLLNDLFKSFFGQRAFQKSSQNLKFFSDFVYYGFTTLMGTQTLGEEYSDIILVDGQRRPLGFPQKLISIAMMVFTPFLVKKIFAVLKKQNNDLVQVCEQILLGPTFSIHLAIFYFTGAYHHVVKRFSGVRYV